MLSEYSVAWSKKTGYLQVRRFSVTTCELGTAPTRAQLASHRRHRLSPTGLCKPKGSQGARTSRKTKLGQLFDFKLSGKL